MAPLNENSNVWFNTGAKLLGNQLNDDHRADFANVAEGLSQILRNRFQAQQAEEFKNNELAQFMQKSSEFGQTYSMIEDPDKAVEAFTDYKNSVMMPFITNTSLKYQSNPTIMQTAQKVFEMGPQINDYIGVQNLKVAQAGAAAQATNAQANLIDANQRAAGTASEIKYREWEMANKGGPLPSDTPDMVLRKIRTMQGGEEIDAQSYEMIAGRRASARATQYDPVMGRQFGEMLYTTTVKDENGVTTTVPGDKDREKEILNSSGDLLKYEFEYGRLLKFYSPAQIDQMFPGMYDHVKGDWTGTTKAPKPLQIRGAVKDPLLLGVLLGRSQGDVGADSVPAFMAKIQTSSDPTDMGDQFMAAMKTAIQVDGKLLRDPRNKYQPIQFSDTDYKANREKLKSLLLGAYQEEIVNTLTVDDEATASTRKKLAMIGAAAVNQYLQDFADDLGVKIIPPSERKRPQFDQSNNAAQQPSLLRRGIGSLF